MTGVQTCALPISGVLIGMAAMEALGAKPAKIVTLDLFPGRPVGAQRHNGFLKGFGLAAPDAKSNELGKASEVVCMADSYGDQAKGQTAMENCLQKNPDINLVYTINEPAALGAAKALEAAGKTIGKDVQIVSVDGGSAGIQGVVDGKIGATSQQYPLQMANLGIKAIYDLATTGTKPSVTEGKDFFDTGVKLCTNTPQDTVTAAEQLDATSCLDIAWG